MDKKDLAISNDDLADIFGTGDMALPATAESVKKAAAPEPVKKAAAPEAVKKEEPKKAPEEMKSRLIVDRAEEAYRAQELLAAQAAEKAALAKASSDKSADKPAAGAEHSVDDLVKRAQELEKEMSAPQSAELKFADFIDEKTVSEIIHAFNDLKAAFAKELAGKIDQKSTDNMMLRSLEKSALNYVLFKNTSWDADGTLKQDGSIDADRFVKNMVLYREQIQEIDKEIEESLKGLMLMRLLAVKKGLGADKYAEIKNGIIRRAAVVEGGHRKAIARFIKKNIMENSMGKADEEK